MYVVSTYVSECVKFISVKAGTSFGAPIMLAKRVSRYYLPAPNGRGHPAASSPYMPPKRDLRSPWNTPFFFQTQVVFEEIGRIIELVELVPFGLSWNTGSAPDQHRITPNAPDHPPCTGHGSPWCNIDQGDTLAQRTRNVSSWFLLSLMIRTFFACFSHEPESSHLWHSGMWGVASFGLMGGLKHQARPNENDHVNWDEVARPTYR